MTDENKDSPPPKLRLSPQPRDSEAETKPEAEETPQSKPDLQLKRPEEAEATPEAKEAPELKLRRPGEEQPATPPAKAEPEKPAPPLKAPADTKEPAVQPNEERPIDPENPLEGAGVKNPAAKTPPPDLPSKPAPTQEDDSGHDVEDTIDRIDDTKKSHSIFVSILVVIILLLILGGSGYGLYYILRNPAKTADSTAASEQKTTPVAEQKTAPVVKAVPEKKMADDAEKASEGLLSGPISKTKATITEVAKPESTLEEVTEQEEDTTPEEVNEPEPVPAPVKSTAASAPPVDPARTKSISEFLQNAHIGGMRTGDRPKLILNGKSYEKGDLVDPDNGLRFIGLRDDKLAFQDAQGVIYIKSF